MIYRTYTKTKTAKFPVIFKCEHCGKYNVILHPFSVSASYTDKNALTKKNVAKREEYADESLNKRFSALYDKIANATKNNDFKNAEYYCTCNYCQTKPLWSFFKNKTLETICNIALYISFIVALFLFLPIIEGDYSTINGFCILLGILALLYIPRFILYQSKKSKIIAMDEEYKPLIFNNEADFYNKLHEFGIQLKRPESPAQTTPPTAVHKWLCDNCNNMRSQTPCEHCGAQ